MESQTGLSISPPAKRPPRLLARIRQSQNLALGLIFMVMLIDVMGMTLLFPVSAYIVQQYSREAFMYILLNVVYASAQFFAAPVLGNLSDRFGRRSILLICLLGAGVGYLVFGFAGALWMLFVARLVGGITGGSISTASAYIVDVSPPEIRASRLTLVSLAWGIGLVIGPALGGLLGQIDLRAPAFCAAVFCLANLALAFLALPESLPKERRVVKPMRPNDFIVFNAIGKMGRVPGLAIILVVLSIFNFAFNGIISTETLFMIYKFKADPLQLGSLPMTAGITLAFVQMALVPRLVPRFGEKRVALACLLLITVGSLATCLSPVFWLIYPVMVLRSISSGMVFPTLGSLSTRLVPSSEQGALAGVTTALGSLSGIFSPLFSGSVYDLVSPAAPYFTSAVMFVVAAVLLFKRQPSTPAVLKASIAR